MSKSLKSWPNLPNTVLVAFLPQDTYPVHKMYEKLPGVLGCLGTLKPHRTAKPCPEPKTQPGS